MLPPTIPVFPLPNVVLFPNVFLPLHIFESRYRKMVDEALGGDRIIGMVLLRPGWEQDYEGRPSVYPIGCAGVITHAERLADGRFEIEVSDRGPGVPPVMLETMFEPFVKGPAESRGVGLCLSIARRALAVHGGALQAFNREGGGLTMRIAFPAAG